jgi:potassium efflux system protein
MHNVFKYILLVTAAYFITIGNGYAQVDNSESRSLNKKQRRAMHSRDSVLRSFNKADTSVNSQLQKLEQYSITFNLIKNNLAAGLDTSDITAKVPSTLRRINKIKDQANTHKSSTLRYLFVLRDNLDHIQERLEGWQDDLDAVDDKLIQNQNDLLKFTKDSLILTTIPTDSVIRKTFFDRRKDVILLWITADSANRKSLFKINLLQNRVAIAYSNALDETDQIDTKVKRFAERAFEGEFGPIWDIDPQYNNIKTSVRGTVDLNSTQLYYFIRKETTTHFIGLVFLVIVISWVAYNRQKIKRDHKEPEQIFVQANYIYKYPVISALLVPIVIIPYFYDHPPVIFLECFFLTSLVLLLMLVKRRCIQIFSTLCVTYFSLL